MCTLTFASFSGLLRISFNRDEQRTRAGGLPPRHVRCGNRDAIMPLDPVSGGTWIGVNAAGLTACLLNSTRTSEQHLTGQARASRGSIVPRLLAAQNCREAAELLLDVDAAAHLPFRVFTIERYRWCMAESDGHEILIHDIRANFQPLMFTSSGLGDDVVEPPRRALFNDVVSKDRFDAAVQDAFHDHHWIDQPHLSVRMSRSDASTVSRTTIELARNAMMTYEDLSAGRSGSLSSVQLELDRAQGCSIQ